MISRLTLLMMFVVLGQTIVFSQAAGVRAYAGITQGKNQMEMITPSSMVHAGYHFGADARLNGGGMFFNFGARYTVLDLVATDGADYFSNKTKHSIFNGRGGLGFYIYRPTKDISIRSKALVTMNYNMGFDDAAIENNQPYDKLVDASLGAVTGLAFDYKSLCLDLEYEIGLIHAYAMQKESKFNYLTLSLGFFF